MFTVTKLTKIKRQNAGALVNNILKMSKDIITSEDFTDDSMMLLDIQKFYTNREIKKEQIIQLQQYGKLLHSPLNTIEKYGGGSARCMIAEIR